MPGNKFLPNIWVQEIILLEAFTIWWFLEGYFFPLVFWDWYGAPQHGWKEKLSVPYFLLLLRGGLVFETVSRYLKDFDAEAFFGAIKWQISLLRRFFSPNQQFSFLRIQAWYIYLNKYFIQSRKVYIQQLLTGSYYCITNVQRD